MAKNSTEYEKFTRSVVQDLIGDDVTVHHLRVYTGKTTRRKIKIDVSFETQLLGTQVLVLVECKHWNSTVEVGDINKFKTDLVDIGAHKGIVVTTVGFQDGAKKAAAAYGIALVILRDEPVSGEFEVLQKSAEPRPNSPTLRGNLRPNGPRNEEDPLIDPGYRFNSVRDLLYVLAFEGL